MARKRNNSGERKNEEAKGDRVVRLVIPEELCGLFSEEVLGHLINAKKEILLALRGIIDHKLEHLEKRKGGKPPAIKIHVE